MLGAAGLSLSLATSASGGPVVDMPTQSTGMSHQVILIEEEISDVSLATLHVSDKENAGTFRRRVIFAHSAGGCWTGAPYAGFGAVTDANPPPVSTRGINRRHGPKNP